MRRLSCFVQFDAGGFGSAGSIGGDLEADSITANDVTAVLQRADVEENVVAAVIGLDEAKSALVVVHFDFTCWHFNILKLEEMMVAPADETAGIADRLR
jgi:hypothetical protein